MLNLIIACILAGILGFAAHRASICTVRAVAELTHSRTGYMLASIVKSALWVFAITIPVFLLVPQTATGLTGWQLTFTAMFGGLLFGIGAGVNGACAYATMARMVDGEIGMLLTVVRVRDRRSGLRRAARHRHAGPPGGRTEPGARGDACRARTSSPFC